MYQKVLVPLDESVEADDVQALVQDDVAQDAEIVLLQVIPPPKTHAEGGHVILGSQQEDYDRHKAMSYLKTFIQRQPRSTLQWRPEVAVSESVAEGILSFAAREPVDLIAMSTRDRQLLARYVKVNIATEVEHGASAPVRVLRAQESPSTRMLEQVDIFRDLFPHQVEKIVALGERVHIPAGETLGKGGEHGETLFVIIEGEADLSAHSEIGEIAVRVAGPGEAFPLATLLASGTLITSGEALTDMELLTIPRRPLLDLCITDTQIGMGIYSAVGRIFAQRYSVTLAQLAITGERELRNAAA